MTSILYVGLDVHTTNYTICSYSFPEDRFFAEIQVSPDYNEILKYLDCLRRLEMEHRPPVMGELDRRRRECQPPAMGK